jgi:hypothetical protein
MTLLALVIFVSVGVHIFALLFIGFFPGFFFVLHSYWIVPNNSFFFFAKLQNEVAVVLMMK